MDSHCQQQNEQINQSGLMFFMLTQLTYCCGSDRTMHKIPKVLYLQEPTRPLYEAMPKLHGLLQKFEHMATSSWAYNRLL
jgi:hypothetical protein